MNKFVKIKESKDWKDRLCGWCHWRIYIPKCLACGKQNTSYTLHGTRADAERFAGDRQYDCCDDCC